MKVNQDFFLKESAAIALNAAIAGETIPLKILAEKTDSTWTLKVRRNRELNESDEEIKTITISNFSRPVVIGCTDPVNQKSTYVYVNVTDFLAEAVQDLADVVLLRFKQNGNDLKVELRESREVDLIQ
jgi:hypothetical protein